MHLRGIHKLDMSYCPQAGITGSSLFNLGSKLELLSVSGCNPQTIQKANEIYGVTKYDSVVKKHPQLGGRRKFNRKLTRRKRARKSRGRNRSYKL